MDQLFEVKQYSFVSVVQDGLRYPYDCPVAEIIARRVRN